jgi:hypothetical protein
VKAKPLSTTNTLTDRCAELLTAMRRDHPNDPLEWACGDPDTQREVLAVCCAPARVVIDLNARMGQVWLRVRWT